MVYNKISGFSDEMDTDIVTQFETLNKLGIKYFVPRGIDGKNVSELDDEDVMVLKQKMDKYGIRASSIGSPVGKIKLTDDFDEHFDMFKRVVKITKMLNAKYIRIFSFYHESTHTEWTEQERAQVINQLKKMIDYAKENDVVLLHENEKDIYGDTISRCLDLIKELYCDNFKAIFDPANFVQSGQDTKNAFDVLKDYIEYVHIKDAVKENCDVVPAGHGDGNIEYVLKNLFDSGYDGFLSLEPHLGSFEGLAALELDDKMEKLPKSGIGTYTIAFEALCEILKKVL